MRAKPSKFERRGEKPFRAPELFTSTCAFCVLLAGCAVGPNYHPPIVKVEPRFGELADTTNSNPPLAEWWDAFHDAELSHLIAEALHENFNLQIAAERIREARFQRGIAAADLFPSVDADAGYMRALGSKNVVLPFGGGGAAGGGGSKSGSDPPGDPPTGGSGSGAPTPSGGNQLTPLGKGGLPGVATSLYQLGFDSNWELDVFGGTRRQVEAAAADMEAAVENLHDVRVTLLAEVARNYVELRGTQKRLAVARENLATQKQVLDLTLSRANSGLTSRGDAVRAAALVATTSATIQPLEISVRRSIHALSALLEKEPTALATELEQAKPVPLVPPEVPVGLPSELLKRRPDIRRAERQIAAATARIGSAKAELFPKFALTGGIGLDSTSTGNLFDWQSHYFLISPTVTWRIFDAGRIISNIGLQKANRRETVLQYHNAIFVALREVEDALVAYSGEHVHRGVLGEAVARNQESLELARDQYEHGLATFLDVLDAQRNVLGSQDQLAQSDQTLATDLVALYKALGGGWDKTQLQTSNGGRL